MSGLTGLFWLVWLVWLVKGYKVGLAGPFFIAERVPVVVDLSWVELIWVPLDGRLCVVGCCGTVRYTFFERGCNFPLSFCWLLHGRSMLMLHLTRVDAVSKVHFGERGEERS